MSKDDIGIAFLFIVAGIFAIGFFIVFFPFILTGTILLAICGITGGIIYEIYQGFVIAEKKLFETTHHKH